MRRRQFIKSSAYAAAIAATGFGCVNGRRKDTRVLVLGAGLSGLYAAHILDKKGIDYQIIEGSERIGGRLNTKKYNGTNVELGGVEIGDGYNRTLALSKEVRVALNPPKKFPRGWMIHYDGQSMSDKEWSDSDINPLPEAYKNLAPYRLESYPLLGDDKVPFQTTVDWYSKDFHNLDYPYSEYLKDNGYTEEMIKLANHTANHNGLSQISTSHIMRSIAYRMMGTSKKTLRVDGGSQRLPEAIAKNLERPPKLNHKVVSIVEQKDCIEVRFKDSKTIRADKVICTLPFSVLRDIKIEASTSKLQREAISQVDYTAISIGIIEVKRKFWEDDGMPIYMWTDTEIERVFSANHPDEDQAFMKVFINGKNARNTDKLTDIEFRNLVESRLAEVRPSTKGNVRCIDRFSWSKNPFSKGAYAEFQAGQVRKYVPEMSKPTKRLFFAGEHMSFDDKGIEGALASAEQAVNQLEL